MAIPKRRSLTGTCGIPKKHERVCVRVFDKTGSDVRLHSGQIPKRVIGPGMAAWEVGAISCGRKFGRELFGNLCVRFAVAVRGVQKTLW